MRLSDELLARQASPRVRGVERHTKRGCHFGDGDAVELVQDEDGAAVELERFERRVRKLDLLALQQSLERTRRGVERLELVIEHLAAEEALSSMCARDAEREPEQPGFDGPPGHVLLAVSMDLQEDFVGQVFQIRRRTPRRRKVCQTYSK